MPFNERELYEYLKTVAKSSPERRVMYHGVYITEEAFDAFDQKFGRDAWNKFNELYMQQKEDMKKKDINSLFDEHGFLKSDSAEGGPQTAQPISSVIRSRLINSNTRYWAGDNIAEHITEDEKKLLIDEVTEKFEAVLDSLLIDRFNDPNSMDTGRRMAKMYINEIMEGRYTPEPKITAFPNDDVDNRYAGMLVTRAEIKSMCSHHHQTVSGTCWIAILPSTKVIGLSKYARLAQWYARRGTLQEELTKQIADGIEHHTGSKDLAVIIKAEHGCCTNRGIMANDSSTWTSILRGQFYNPSVKQELFAMIGGNMGGGYACR